MYHFVNIYFSVIWCLTLIVSNGNTLDTTKTALNVDNPISGPTGENKDLKKVETRFNDPPPEYYKGPSSSSNRDRYDSYDLKYNGVSNRPYLGSNGYVNPYLSKHGFYGNGASKDRISVGSGYYNGGGGGDYASNGYSSYDRARPYGPPQSVSIPSGSYGGYDSYDSHGLDWGSSGYGGGGGNGGHGYNNIWADKFNHLSKSNLVPIAGAALIGIAAALLVNPVLLQLGTVTGKRRRRSITSNQLKMDKSNGQDLAYHGYKMEQK